MGEPVSYKVFLSHGKENSDTEVRRFLIDKEESRNFNLLKEKVASVFPTLREDADFFLSWQDSEGDKVTIGTDEELAIALIEMTGPLFKLYVKTQERQKKSNGRDFETIDVTCGGCDKTVSGMRYKCIVCKDFNLCTECEEGGKHPGHKKTRTAGTGIVRSKTNSLFNRVQKVTERTDKEDGSGDITKDTEIHETDTQPITRQEEKKVKVESTDPSSEEDDEWTVVSEKENVNEHEKTTEMTIQKHTNHEKGKLYPTLPEEKNVENISSKSGAVNQEKNLPASPSIEKPPSKEESKSLMPPMHPDPKIQIATQAMMNMGFTNESGWLSNLLEAKNGDIGKVLDILQPVKN